MRRNSSINDSDLAYMRSLSAAVVQRSPRYLIRVLVLMTLAVCTGIGWMAYAEVDVVVRGSGKVVPSQQLQVVQSLEGGVVSEILVREGQLVEPGAALVKISDIAFASSFEENRVSYLELKANIVRLAAEAIGDPFGDDPELREEAPVLLRAARSLFDTREKQLDQTLQILEEQILQQKNEIVEADSKRRQLNNQLRLMREEISLKEPLVERGLVSKVELLQLRQQESEILGNLDGVRLSLPRLRSGIEETRRKVVQSRLDFRNKAKEELNVAMSEIARISEAQEALQDRVRRTTIRSPVKGTVTRLNINTVGGVISPGEPIMEIVPFEDSLLVQVSIKPADIANIGVGQLARLKFSAYDFAIHGSLDGQVNFLSADTVTNEEGESFFIARVRPEREFLGLPSKQLPIRVGMTAEADIITDKKTILEYLLKPISRGLGKALSEG